MHTNPRIAIIGAGPGGLTLARIFICPAFMPPCSNAKSPLARPQGGTLDLHEDSGLLAVQRAGLDSSSSASRATTTRARACSTRPAACCSRPDASAGNRPEVDRTALRDMLLASLPAGCAQWGRALSDMRLQEGGRWNLSFTGGSEAGPFDLVVGADGAWSRVRPLLSPYKPQYSGLTFIEFGIDDVDRSHPAIAQLVGRGKLDVQGDGKAIIVQRNGNAHIRGYAIFRVPADWAAKRFDFSSPAAVRSALLAEFAGLCRCRYRPLPGEQRPVRPSSHPRAAGRPLLGAPARAHAAGRCGACDVAVRRRRRERRHARRRRAGRPARRPGRTGPQRLPLTKWRCSSASSKRRKARLKPPPCRCRTSARHCRWRTCRSTAPALPDTHAGYPVRIDLTLF